MTPATPTVPPTVPPFPPPPWLDDFEYPYLPPQPFEDEEGDDDRPIQDVPTQH